jgi:MFS family permease
MPATLSIVQQIFAPGERQKAVSIWAGAASIGVPIGPIVGGFLLEHYWWGSVFLINVPVVVVAIAAGAFLIPASVRRDAPLDWAGAGLIITGLFLLVYGLIEAPRYGWTSLTTLGLLVAAVVVLIGFYSWQTRTPHPLLPPSLLRVPRFSVTATAIILMAFGLFGVIYILTQYLQLILGYSPLQAGIRLMPIATIAVGAGIGLLLAKRVGTKWVLVAGLLVMAVGQFVLAGIGADTEARALWALAVVGLGLGSLGPASDLLLGAVPPDKAGIGSAMTDTTLQLGGSLGVAVLGSVIATTYTNNVTPVLAAHPIIAADAAASASNSLSSGLTVASQLGSGGDALRAAAIDGFLTGAQTSLYIACVITIIGALLSAWLLPGKAETTS